MDSDKMNIKKCLILLKYCTETFTLYFLNNFLSYNYMLYTYKPFS
jgi:hypothetical protein